MGFNLSPFFILSPSMPPSPPMPTAQELICVNKEHQIYVCDLGLTENQSRQIVETTEHCSKGHYAAYTYAKQTLGCREHDELAVVCEYPVMRAVSTIERNLNVEWKKITTSSSSSSSGSGGGGVGRRRQSSGNEQQQQERSKVVAVRKKELVLDDREPHMVKYDVTKKERQKLDMHTDKSEWTFLIACSEGNGVDYEGGGTYFEAIDSTVHLQMGHMLIFPGKLRHRGQKITKGLRFLLVGFLVDKNGDDGGENNRSRQQQQASAAGKR
mmetsp:Transcript_23735/g.35023  ORF Transcript_23735/g.35023 Transcript_23735/m.35023 type:complete len:269 (-) Transcript_23735:371-1177(-)